MAHLLIITSSFPTDKSGAEAAGSFVADFVDELSKRTKVTVLAPGNVRASESSGELTVKRFPVPSLPLSLLKFYNPVDWYSIYKTLHSGRLAVQQLFAEGSCDFILALWALPSGYWARYAARIYGVPYAVWALGSDIWSLEGIPFVNTYLRNILRDASLRFADGYVLKRDVERVSGGASKFLPSTRHLGHAGKKEIRSNPPYRLAYLGRWHRNKGIDLLLEALAYLTQSDWDKIEAVRICGGGPLEGDVTRKIEALKRTGNPVFQYGYLDKSGASELLEWADYLCIPSRIESIPVVFSDALQARVPVIAMPAGDLSVLLAEHKVGILAEEISAVAFSRAIKQALDTDSSVFLEDMISAGRKFDLTEITTMLLRTINIQ